MKFVLVSFVDPTINDGAGIRLRSLVKFYFDQGVKDITVCTISDIAMSISTRSHWRVSDQGYLLLHKDHIVVSVSDRIKWLFSRVPSININRKPEPSAFPDYYEIFDKDTKIVCHTTRMFWSVPRQFRKNVVHVDHCDDLVTTYWNAAIKMFKDRRFAYSFIFLWEWMFEISVEAVGIWRRMARTFVTRADLQSVAERDESAVANSFFVANRNQNVSVNPSSTDADLKKGIRFGVIGNFRTLANRSIVKNIVNARAFNRAVDQIVIAGLGADKLADEYAYDQPSIKLTSLGTFDSLEELVGGFDCGVCLVDVQGGVQTKVYDYLNLRLLVWATNSVTRPFLETGIDSEFFIGADSTRKDILKAINEAPRRDWSEVFIQLSSGSDESIKLRSWLAAHGCEFN